MRCFSDIRLQKCRDLEIRVRSHSRSLKVVPFDSSIETLSLRQGLGIGAGVPKVLR